MLSSLLKPEYLLIVVLLGIVLLAVDASLAHEEPTGAERIYASETDNTRSPRVLHDLGIALLFIGGIPFAVWKSVYFFQMTGRHRY